MLRPTFLLAFSLSLPIARAEEPGAPTPPAPVSSRKPIPTSDERVLYGLGVRGRALFVPDFMLSPFLTHYTTLTSGGVAIEGIVRRKGTLDIVLALDYSHYNPPDGNYLGNGKDARLDTHYMQFRNLGLVGLEVNFFWVHDIVPWLAFMVGGGVGLGVVVGDIYQANNSDAVCTAANAGDPNQCYPISSQGPIRPTDPDFQKKLEATASNPGKDTAQNPKFHAVGEKPPVLPTVTLVIGFKLKLHRHFNFNISGGFRDGFVVGAGPEYVF